MLQVILTIMPELLEQIQTRQVCLFVECKERPTLSTSDRINMDGCYTRQLVNQEMGQLENRLDPQQLVNQEMGQLEEESVLHIETENFVK